jgi:hypothetical protein
VEREERVKREESERREPKTGVLNCAALHDVGEVFCFAA